MKQAQLHFFENESFPEIPMSEDLVAPETLASAEENSDARIFLTNENGSAVAHAALWWKETPALDGKKSEPSAASRQVITNQRKNYSTAR
ncbi:MAG: hypothetical protein HC845_09405 [Akkermansiaceae bacterium]|nr:hypothetical protein [Akkermansiaceae bacterium]